MFLGTLLKGNSGVPALVGLDTTRGRLLQKKVKEKFVKIRQILSEFVKIRHRSSKIRQTFFFSQTAARGAQAATGSDTRVALQQCPKEN